MQRGHLSLILLTVYTILSFSCNQKQAANETTDTAPAGSAPVNTTPQNPVEKNKVVGDWIRTDAPYQLKITELSEGGLLKAGYFNPNPINVGKANWQVTNGALQLYIELRDENYPGSNYTLTYLPEKNLLVGSYFQAVQGVSYDIAFMRAK
ncbi:hypothetical protein [Flavihumibacter profundi]|uniref:hypothetical protein n=1 Tax=Flavihumibacter profundi TaxID=2716883 RepID=UPI001CC54A57|nr:hypothetical protein [Flavihumibacter profundi]MBZ5858583.1 hypothetical protein [Flavihumibacter profundi]